MRRLDVQGFAREEGGVAAMEFALIAAILIPAFMNMAEVARYAFTSAQVGAAAQSAAQAAIIGCDVSHVPVTTNCPELQSMISGGVASSSLGDSVTLKAAPTESWYCLSSTGELVFMAAASSKPTDCASAGVPAGRPALYLQIQVTYTYEPMFPGLTIAERFASDIERTATMRMI